MNRIPRIPEKHTRRCHLLCFCAWGKLSFWVTLHETSNQFVVSGGVQPSLYRRRYRQRFYIHAEHETPIREFGTQFVAIYVVLCVCSKRLQIPPGPKGNRYGRMGWSAMECRLPPHRNMYRRLLSATNRSSRLLFSAAAVDGRTKAGKIGRSSGGNRWKMGAKEC